MQVEQWIEGVFPSDRPAPPVQSRPTGPVQSPEEEAAAKREMMMVSITIAGTMVLMTGLMVCYFLTQLAFSFLMPTSYSVHGWRAQDSTLLSTTSKSMDSVSFLPEQKALQQQHIKSYNDSSSFGVSSALLRCLENFNDVGPQDARYLTMHCGLYSLTGGFLFFFLFFLLMSR